MYILLIIFVVLIFYFFFKPILFPPPPPTPIDPNTKNLPKFPTDLPTESLITDNKYSSTVALFCIYLIQLMVLVYKSNQFDVTDPEPSVSRQLTPFLPKDAKIIQFLKWSCPFGKQFYGGFILEYQNTSFIVFRGTQEECEWFSDFEIKLISPEWIPPLLGAKVHSGFNNTYTDDKHGPSLRDRILQYINSSPSKEFVFTGHSLGGGLCFLIAADLAANFPNLRQKSKFYTFAGPYSGNAAFVDLIMKYSSYSGIFSTINTLDPVPTNHLSGFQRVPTQLYCFTEKGSNGLGSVHFPDTYRLGLENNKAIFDSSPANQTCPSNIS